MSKRIIILLLSALISLGLIRVTVQNAYQHAYREQYDTAARPLRIERSKVEKELSQVKKELKTIVIGKGAAVILFEELHENLYKKALPILKDYRYTGVMALSLKSLPDAEGCITMKQFDYLLAHGWTTCVYWDDSIPLERYMEELSATLKEMDIPVPKAVVVSSGGYHTFKDKDITAAGFTTVIHHGEPSDLDVIARSDEEELFHIGAAGWNTPNVRSLLSDTISYGGSLVVSLDFSSPSQQFDEEYFPLMCDYLKSQEENLYLTDLTGARKNITMRDSNDYYSARKEYLEGELRRYDREIAAIYALDLSELQKMQ